MMNIGGSDRVRLCLLAGAAAIGLIGTPAFAQAADSVADGTTPGDIVVTANRRAERLVDVPMAVVAVSSEAVEKSGVVSVHDINKLAPGVQINYAGCCTQPAIRGVSTLTTGVGFENNVAIYIDGFYAPDNLSINGDLANLDSIEVLKGPQGTLWGRNATGGAILMNTKRPSDVFTGKLEVGYASFDELTLSGYLSGPLAKGVRFSISAYDRKGDGYYKLQDVTGKVVGNAAPVHQQSFRGKLEVELGEKTTVTLGANYSLASDPRSSLFTVLQYPSSVIPPPPARADQPYTASFNYPTASRASVTEGTAKIVHEAGFGTITSYTGYAERKTFMSYDFDASYNTVLHSEASWKQKTFQQTIDFNITAINGVDLVVGGSYYRDNLFSDSQKSVGSFGTNARSVAELDAEALAAYLDASIHLSERLVLTAGARYTNEKKRFRYSRYSLATGALQRGPFDEDVSFNAFTPHATLRYELAPKTNIYASISRGFRSGGFNPNGANALGIFPPFRPEKITAYELGFKTAGSMVQFETSAFYYDYRDLQVGITKLDPDVGLISSTFNAKAAEVYGIDGILTVSPVEDLNLKLGLAYVHGRYTDFAGVNGIGLNSATNLNVGDQPQDLTGYQMARAPTFSGNFSFDYTIRNVVGGSLGLASSIQFTSSFVTNNPSLYGPLALPALQTQQRFRQSAYATANAQITWTDANEHIKLTLYVNNLTDKLYRMSYNGNFQGDYAVFAQPRTWGARLAYQF